MTTDSTTSPETETDPERAARLAVCRYATDVTDARMLLDMLGLLPATETTCTPRPPDKQTTCLGCNRRMARNPRPGEARRRTSNRCSECARAEAREKGLLDLAERRTCTQCGQEFTGRRHRTQCSSCSAGHVDIGRARRHLGALRARMPLAEIRRRTGLAKSTLQAISCGPQRHVRPEVEQKILSVPIDGASRWSGRGESCTGAGAAQLSGPVAVDGGHQS